MTDASLPAGRFTAGDFRIGHVLSKTASVLSRNFLTYFVVTAIASLPPLLVGVFMSSPEAADPVENLAVGIFGLFLTIVLGTLSQAIVLSGAFHDMRGRPVSLADCFRVGLRRFFPIIGLALSVGVLILLASILFIIPGLILYTMWFVATPTCVVERLGPFRSMRRSRALTKGHRWKIFGLLLVAQILNLIWSAIWSAFFAILVVVTYHDLRVAKEGLDTEQIAAVFD